MTIAIIQYGYNVLKILLYICVNYESYLRVDKVDFITYYLLVPSTSRHNRKLLYGDSNSSQLLVLYFF